MTTKVLMLDDESSAVVLESLRKFRDLLQGYQRTRVAQRVISLHEEDTITVRNIEKNMEGSDRAIKVTDALIKSIEEA